MRTKTLLSVAAALAAGVITTQAQSNVYSVNIVGYVNKSVTTGLQIVANPLNATNNALSTIVPAPADFTQVLRWNGSDFDTATFFFGAWDSDFVIAPGEGFFINAAGDFTNTFVGSIDVGSYTNDIPAGVSLKSSIVPVGGTADDIGLTAAVSDFDQVQKWNQGLNDYDTYTYFFGAWDVTPTLDVAEGAVISSGAGGSWVQTLNP